MPMAASTVESTGGTSTDAALPFLSATAGLLLAGGLLQLRYKAPRPVPPTSAQIAKMYVSEGPSNMQALSALVKNADEIDDR